MKLIIELYKLAAAMLIKNASFNPAGGTDKEIELIIALLIFTEGLEGKSMQENNKLLLLPADELCTRLQQNADAAPFVAGLAASLPDVKNAVIKNVAAVMLHATANPDEETDEEIETSYDETEEFYSSKTKRSHSYRNAQELKLLKTFEADPDIQTYESFLLPIMNSKTAKPLEEAMGYILSKNTAVVYVLLSEVLSVNAKYAAAIKPMIMQKKGAGKFVILNAKKVDSNVLSF